MPETERKVQQLQAVTQCPNIPIYPQNKAIKIKKSIQPGHLEQNQHEIRRKKNSKLCT